MGRKSLTGQTETRTTTDGDSAASAALPRWSAAVPLDFCVRIAKIKRKSMAASTARAELETLLRSRKLDTTLTTALPAEVVPADRLAPTGQAGLDRALGGGVPRGQISELVGRRST